MSAPRKKKGKKSSFEQEQYDQEIRKTGADTFLDPSASAANAIGDLARNVDLNGEGIIGVDIQTLADGLRTQNEAMHQGDLERVEAMLLDQAHVLQTLFSNFIQGLSRAKYLSQIETYSRIALKAQNQCRQTLATLGELKNPKRATFIKQQNNAVNQQINQDGKQVENQKNSGNTPNELLEELPHERLDTGTAQAAIGADQAMETVGAIDRAKDI